MLFGGEITRPLLFKGPVRFVHESGHCTSTWSPAARDLSTLRTGLPAHRQALVGGVPVLREGAATCEHSGAV